MFVVYVISERRKKRGSERERKGGKDGWEEKERGVSLDHCSWVLGLV